MIRYTDSLAGITATQLDGFFDGWPKHPSSEVHLNILHGSTHFVVAVESETGLVVGFVTALSDGVLAASIPLLEVRPGWRDGGIGTQLMERIMVKLEGLYMVDLVCDAELQGFYQRLGWTPSTAVCQRNHAQQAGRGVTSLPGASPLAETAQ